MNVAHFNARKLRLLTSARDASGRGQVLRSLGVELQSLSQDSPEFINLVRLLTRLFKFSLYEDVRVSASAIFEQLKFQPAVSEPSRFEPPPPFVFDETDWSKLARLGRIGHLEWAMSAQPYFIKLFSNSMDALMNSEGPLPPAWRNYLAILAASRYNCEYLAVEQAELFLANGGDPDWLKPPFSSVPRKLKSLSRLNVKLTHSPWALDACDFEQVISEGRWSSSELAHALCILSTYHCLPSIIFALGLNPECDSSQDALLSSEPSWAVSDALPRCFADASAKGNILSRIGNNRAPAPSPPRPPSSDFSAFDGFGALSEAAKKPAPERLAGQPKMTDEEKEDLQAVMAAAPKWQAQICEGFRAGDETTYEDIRVRDDRVLHWVHFSWEDHAVVILAQSLGPAADAISDEYTHLLEHTNGKIGDVAVDTRHVRDALTKYVQRMFGVCHDDYPYDQLNRILPLLHKVFLKKMACFPERLTRADYWRMRTLEGLSAADIVHYAFLVFESKSSSCMYHSF